jgi:ribosomal protein S18 acetylase RimI-like enzyme
MPLRNPVLTQRPEIPGDDAFLRRLMMGVIAEELGAAAWPEPMRSHLMEIQYQTRRQARRMDHPASRSFILKADGENAGWMLISTPSDVVWLVEIAVLPELQGRGIGSAAIRRLLTPGATVRLHVNKTNGRAITLYHRLGFTTVDSNEVQWVMECRC